MNRFYLILCLLAPLASMAGRRLTIDSVDIATKKPVRVGEYRVGDADYRKFGSLSVGRIGDSFSITLPIVRYTHAPQTARYRADEVIPAGTKVTIKLGSRKIITTTTQQDINVLWHFLWHYRQLSWWGGSQEDHYTFHGLNVAVQRSKQGFGPPDPYTNTDMDLYALNWMVCCPLTRDDITLLSRRRITDAYMTVYGMELHMPIKTRQAGHIQHLAGRIVRK